MMIFSRFDGYLGTHICQYCNSVFPVAGDIIRIAHFRTGTNKQPEKINDYLHNTYTSNLKKMILNTH